MREWTTNRSSRQIVTFYFYRKSSVHVDSPTSLVVSGSFEGHRDRRESRIRIERDRGEMLNTLVLIICLVFLTASEGLGLDFLFHSDGPYKGKVIDLETAEPIEGAVAAGVWFLEFGFTNPFCDAKEVLTDKRGQFILPRAWCFDPSPFAGMGGDVIVFKPGYLGYPPLGAMFEERQKRMPGFTGMEFKHMGQYNIIRLGRATTGSDRNLTLSEARSKLGTFNETSRKLPILLKLINEERRNLQPVTKSSPWPPKGSGGGARQTPVRPSFK